jgi:hypothetical protein
MSTYRLLRLGLILLSLGALLSLSAGCETKLVPGGEDSNYLKDLPTPARDTTSTKLFPLVPGNYWELNAVSDTKRYHTKIVATGARPILGNTGVHLQLLRDGVLWRQEVYRNDSSGLYLLAYGEKKPDLLVLDPPLQLTKHNIVAGDDISWTGNVRFQGKTYPATAYTRISTLETLNTHKGRFQAYRLDSVISMTRPGEKPLHFPSIRWLSKGIGIIRRSYADSGKPALEELDKYMVNGAG